MVNALEWIGKVPIRMDAPNIPWMEILDRGIAFKHDKKTGDWTVKLLPLVNE